ncbi:molecular chaperone Tir [bacterium M00.F.Ca.ET.228.01.1.1]|uniref:CesT family type III secretion system chaperone n=1 Tax=Paraburkholderia phenoliruptrix TaxID=252970 RepID=UPI001092A038|nr:CesT family type III secretion system chaperone [Paraburkholderia phenoliruptrix]TGP41516.1 molecular chaperone Tir [bacterium M00.F.Ca.ET.228.01.1.1]TGR98174.1 molecular chaperone Tir [bacterium M00.F.Ca.ET.191.01.1.1]TGU02365.1 molecular chaperone Tir [bacterium M00.F.Ca.ET.155.01.1.1]MBW0447168.1 CesT family type III secretion system chaperone [Paraburkholderia phenoliruptrix]MBW9101449.1 CesT family type III secretion system chaperone [Paraburkholderia phenoliruptrix]
MSIERRDELIREICALRDIPAPDAVLQRGVLEIDGFDAAIDHFEEDQDALYVTFQFGIVTAGRTLRVFRLLLEANLAVYAQDQAQLGLETDTGGIVLIARVALGDGITGQWMLELIEHYVEHGRYWRDNIFVARDDLFENLARGDYVWIRA